MLGEPGRPNQTDLFACPCSKNDVAGEGRRIGLPLPGQSACDLEYGGDSRRIVVGAWMNQSFLAFAIHRARFAMAEVIVMRADHQIFPGAHFGPAGCHSMVLAPGNVRGLETIPRSLLPPF